MKIVKNPGYLWIPAYIVGGTAAAASLSLLPIAIGVPLSAALVIALLTPISLVHCSSLELEGNLFIYGLTAGLSLLFAYSCISTDLGPIAPIDLGTATKISWIQVAFFATQQVCYFGIHAFTGKSD